MDKMLVYVIWLGTDGKTHSNYFNNLTSSWQGWIHGNGNDYSVQIPVNNITLIRPATQEEMDDDVANQVWHLQHPNDPNYQ